MNYEKTSHSSVTCLLRLLLVCLVSCWLVALPVFAQNEAESTASESGGNTTKVEKEEGKLEQTGGEERASSTNGEASRVKEEVTASAGNAAEAAVIPQEVTVSNEKLQPGAVAVTPGDAVAGARQTEASEPGMSEESEEIPNQELKTDGEVLPEFAQDQPGFIPDTTPEDLFAEEPRTRVESQQIGEFATLLGTSKLPPDEIEKLIEQYRNDPASGLDDNYARVIVPDGDIQGSTETKQFHIEGGLIVFFNEVTITGDNADIDEKNELAIITGNVSIIDPKYTLKTDELRIFFNDKRFQAKGFVQFEKNEDISKSDPDMTLGNKDRLREYMAAQKFELYCNNLFYNWDTKELTALESVRLVHPSFNGTMERVEYNDEIKAYEMNGSVIVTVDKYNWIFETKVAAPEDEKKVRAITDQSTKIECDRLVYSEETGVAQFYSGGSNQVIFDQTARKLTASYVEINDETKDFHAEGSPEAKALYEQLNGEWMFTAELLKREEISTELQEAVEGPLRAEMQTMTYNYDRKRLELLGGVSLTSGQRALAAKELIQDETAKYFLVRGNVHIKPDTESEVYAAQVYLDTAQDVLTFVGLVQGEMYSNDMNQDADESVSGAPQYQAAAGLFRQQGSPSSSAAGRGTSSAPSGSASRSGSSTSNTAESN